MTEIQTADPWRDDLLSFLDYGQTFTNLVKSIEDSKVISIEAGFGHGKTFFRKAWAEQLRQAGEVVVEIDAQQSDHSGEPIITFLGALLAIKPNDGKSLLAKVGIGGMKVAGAATRSILRAVLRNGAEELIETASEYLSAKAKGNEAIEGAIEEVEEGMSKVAGHMIVTQLAAEQARQVELPQQIDALLEAVTEGREAKRVVILIDELDRCHPDYAISLLEAMKLVFGRPGFVFFLMVNADYLESIAHHRFGTKDAGENYLEKFVDLRLTLKAAQESTKSATTRLALDLPLNIPFGEGQAFSLKAAANLAGSIASSAGLSFRQIKRVLSRVELAARCYRDKPIDLPLLVFLAFADVARKFDGTLRFDKGLLPRATLTAEQAESMLNASERDFSMGTEEKRRYACDKYIKQNCAELVGLPDHLYRLPPPDHRGTYYDHYKVLKGLGTYYIAEHREMLASVHRLMAPTP